jgi:FkbM family methyltransferase
MSIRNIIAWVHLRLINSRFSRIYAALILTPEAIKTIDGMKFSIPSGFVNFWVEWFGKHPQEKPTQDWLRENVRKGDLVYNVGANIGWYVVFLQQLGAEVTAFEPEPLNFAELVKNSRLNGKATLYPAAVSNRNGWANFYVVDAKAGNASGYLDTYVLHEGERSVVGDTKVPLMTLSDLPSPDILLIDVDGGEVDVLEGANLENTRAVIVEVEQPTAMPVNDLLEGKGFCLSSATKFQIGNEVITYADGLRLDRRRGNMIYVLPPEIVGHLPQGNCSNKHG